MSFRRDSALSPGNSASAFHAPGWNRFTAKSEAHDALDFVELCRQFGVSSLAQLDASFGKSFSGQLLTLASLSNLEEQASGLVHFIIGLQQADQPEAASQVRDWLDRQLASRSQAWALPLRSQLKRETGQNSGDFGQQAEALLRSLVRGATDSAMLGGMMVGPVLGEGLRAASLARRIAPLWFGKALGFGGEVAGTWLMMRGMQSLQSAEHPVSIADLRSLGLNLLLLRSLAGGHPGLALGGLYIGQHLEETLGWRQPQSGAERGLSSLLFWLNAQVGSRLTGHWLGIRGPAGEWQGRAEQAGRRSLLPELQWSTTLSVAKPIPPVLESSSQPNLEMISKPMLASGTVFDSASLERLIREHGELLRERFALRYEIRATIPPLNHIVEHFAATRFEIDPKRMLLRYFSLLAMVDLPKMDGNDLPRLDLLESSMETFRRLTHLQPFRRAGGSIYDHVLQYGLEQAVSQGNGEDFSQLVRVAAKERSLRGLENFFVSRNWHLKPANNSEIQEPTAAQSEAGLARFFAVYGNNSPESELLAEARLQAAHSPLDWLMTDRILKVLSRGDGTELTKLREIARWQEYNREELERSIQAVGGDSVRLGRAIDATVYTGYVSDPVLARKLGQVYSLRSAYLHPELRAHHWNQLQDRAAELLERRERLAPPELRRHVSFTEADLIQLLELQNTPLTAVGLEWLRNESVELKLCDAAILQDHWRLAGHDSPAPESLFLPANLSPSHRAMILIENIDPKLSHDEKLAQVSDLTALFAHEVEHLLHHEELNFGNPQQLLTAEMRSASEAQWMRLRNGSGEHWFHAHRVTPQGFGMHLRNEIDWHYFNDEKKPQP